MPHPPTIGIISEDFDGPFQSPLVERVHHELQKIGGRLVFVWGQPRMVAETRIATAHVDGWIMISAREGARQLAGLGKPVILISAREGDIPSVLPDNRSGVLAAMEHLIANGHTRIAFVGYLTNHDFTERCDAYRSALAAHDLPLAPELIVDPGSYDIAECHAAIARLLARGVAFSAVIGANDWAAIGAIQAIHAAGLCVPNDVAVVGFDDMIAAQYHQPPLSSVRQRPDEIGRVALQLLLGQIAGQGTPPPLTRVPTKLIVRDSSRAPQNTSSAEYDQRYRSDDWRARLACDLVQRALGPVRLDPTTRPEQIWPSIQALIQPIDDLAHGAAPTPIPEPAWQEGRELAGSVAALMPVLDLLRQAGYQRIDPRSKHAVEGLISWLIACYHTIAANSTAQLAEQLERQRLAVSTENALLTHFNQTGADPRMLDWMASTVAQWGSLALWERAEKAGTLKLTSIYERETGARPADPHVAPGQFPPLELLPEGLRDASEYILKLSPLATANRQWGYIATLERYIAASYDPIQNRNRFIATGLEREELLASLSERQQTLQAAYERERGLAETIRELGCPLIPLLPGVLLVPLIGALDDQRAQQIVERVLNGVSRERASHVIFDLTAVPLVDTHVAAALIRTAQAVNLLGARVIIVGIRPEIAQSIVSLNVDLGKIETQPNLAAATQGLVYGWRRR